MALAPSIKLINVPKRFGDEDISQYLNRLVLSIEDLRDSVKVLEDTGLFRDTAGRIILDANGLHIFDAAGVEVIAANILSIDSGHITTSGITASSIADGEISTSQGVETATEQSLTTDWIVGGTVTIAAEGGPCVVWASLSVDGTSTATSAVSAELRLRRGTTELKVDPFLTFLGTDVGGSGSPGVVFWDTATATGDRNYDVSGRMSATTAAMVMRNVTLVAQELKK